MATLLGSLVDRALGLAEAPRPRALSRFETAPDLALDRPIDRFGRIAHGEAESASRGGPYALPLAVILRPTGSGLPAASVPAAVDAPSLDAPLGAAGPEPGERASRGRRPDLASSEDRASTARLEPAEPRSPPELGAPMPTIGSATGGNPPAHAERGEPAALSSIARDEPLSSRVTERRPPTIPSAVPTRTATAGPDLPGIDTPSPPPIDPRPARPLPTRPASGPPGEPIQPGGPAPGRPAPILIRPAAPHRTMDEGLDAWPDRRPSSRAGGPVIRVSIGRIEVRSVTAPAPPVRRPAPVRDSAPSLEEYLRARNGRS